MSIQKNLKSNFIFNAIYQITGVLVPLVTTPYLSRVLHAQGFGKYSYAYSVAYYFYIFIRLGLNSYGNRSIAFVRDDYNKLSKTFFEIYATQFFCGVMMTVIYIAYLLLFASEKLLSGVFIIMVISGTIDLTWMLYGLEEFKITSIRDTITKIATALAIFFFVRTADDVWKYALVYSLGFMISQVIAIPVVYKSVHYVKPELSGIKSHIIPNIILFIPTIAVSIYKTMDKIMLGSMSTEEELGYYHGSENVIMVPLALITALGTVMLPRMANMLAKNENSREIENIFDKSILFAMFISTSICIGIMTVADLFVPIFYGTGFEKCITMFYILLPSCIFLAFANVIRTQFLLPRKKDALYIISLFLGAATNVVLNLLLIPPLASVGAAIGTLAAEIVVCVVQAACVFKEANIGRNIVGSVPFVVSGILMFIVFNGYRPHISNEILALLVKIIASGMFYMTVLGIIIFARRKVVKR
jgi:O-antigen/teichoic acid export membrane protein